MDFILLRFVWCVENIQEMKAEYSVLIKTDQLGESYGQFNLKSSTGSYVSCFSSTYTWFTGRANHWHPISFFIHFC